MKIRTLYLSHFLAFNLILPFPEISVAQVSGQVIGFSCSGCHGTDGLLAKPGFAKLNAQPAKRLEKTLLDFKYDRKPSSIMSRITKGYTDKELKAVADYFSTLN